MVGAPAKLKWYNLIWLAVQAAAALFFLIYFGYLLFRYVFLNDGYQDFDTALPSRPMFLAACVVWLKTIITFRRKWSAFISSMNIKKAGLILIGMVLAIIILCTKYYSQLVTH